ncbi:uncharacterized protein OCT59_012520 [Rhizophagus irregularis]|uniref:AAA+ ATPase domain-containing protein n=4 Tax=Rhizophagus irregularis TaxID=588596 RepID=A0A915YQN5_9GLOM|nr:bifunctional AAA family ATPase chaperone/translocase BCS1 [Rhizophagus irregularis DAOM 197198w]UZO01419.1 hypothetical protein OCT59_012520 [Rhizophagus irregularis]GBC40506.1 P-loop containing nucleoside triphosphate hydrolase protein [Rhizophagus irregularis DAOM 181602=DAOM 197198]CAB4480610.1 unnamed protein product [Rhizophagus irregularis]CAB5313397.1 unnamed protein product [Rhizophagus irregularis]
MPKVNYSQIFQPLTILFTQTQLNTILLAYLPSKLEFYLTGIIAVDMFITTVIASTISTSIPALVQFLSNTGTPWGKWGNKKNVTMQIEYYTQGKYGYSYTNVFYEALSWLISQQTKELNDGSFVIQTVDTIKNDGVDDDCAPPNINVLPEKNHRITIEYKEKKYSVTYKIPGQENVDDEGSGSISRSKQSKPSIFLTTVEVSEEENVTVTTEFLNEIVRSYLKTLKKSKVRSRYERSKNRWNFVQTLSSSRGLDSVALNESQENLLKKELETFANDKSFYERIGVPYRRGILLYGKPGTGKTSLINAISSQLSRDIYYLNLKDIKNDNELNAAFSGVPGNQIIVLEDVDTQSKVLHKRTSNSGSFNSSLSSLMKSFDKSDDNSDDDNKVKIDAFAEFSLSTFLGCLDGHILAEGNIIIMTTNHVEHLDPACIRPGRMDVQLNLGYCTHYQIEKMYKSVVENPEAEFPHDILEKIPENLLPPCEVMMTMILYRSEIDLIPEKIYELVAKYKDVKSEEAASANLTEMNETKSEEIKNENKDEKEEVKGEKEEVKNENDEKEEVKGENEEVKDENKDKKDDVKGEKEEVEDENNDEKEDVKGENEEVKDENKDKKEDVKDEFKKEDVNEIKEGVKDKNKEENKEDKKGEEIINEANVNNLNEEINAEDSDSNTDVELEVENDKIKHFKTIETFTVIPQIV